MVDFIYYKDIYLGKVIDDKDSFTTALRLASQYVKKLSCVAVDWTNSAVKDALCAVCDVIHQESARYGIASEGADGYSIAYRETDCEEKILSLLRLYLPQEYLYRGI